MTRRGVLMEFGEIGIWWFSVIVFVGYLVILIMSSTNVFFQQWLPHIQAKADSTYFGARQGTFMLIYTFPILLIATLGCLYLHLKLKRTGHYTQSKKGNSGLASWKRPVLVKGPLGITTVTELFFFVMFLSLLIWSFCSYLHAIFGNITQQVANEREKVWEAKLEDSALALGLVGNICLAFLFFPVSRSSSILQLIGLTSEASIKYHIWLGHIAMALLTAHGLGYFIFWAKTHQIFQVLKWDKIGISNVAGEISLLAGLILWSTTFPKIRRKFFELFFYTHNLYILFVVFFVLHVGFSTTCIILPGFYLFLIDRFLRFLQSQQRIRLDSARVLPCQVVELNFSKNPGLCYAPTSSIFINVPSISKLQWHPFTITSSSETDSDTLSIVVKVAGRWSHALYQKLSSSSPLDHLNVSIEGPYGPTSTFFSRHEMLVMVSGGSGITPFISIIRSLLFRADTDRSKAPRLLLICAFKNSIDLTMLDLILPASTTNFNISQYLQLQIEAYVTREKEEPIKDNDKKLLQTTTIRFKPNNALMDEPISSVLGQKYWLYLGIIISSSFVLFLILIAFLDRYYIYPIDHNSDLIYPYVSRSCIDMGFLCVCIVFTATSAFLWNKKQNKALKQIKNMNTENTMSFPNSERELESLPLQSFVQATRVHYGERPDIKKILGGCEGSSIGVMVSGPRKLRHEVASICASSFTDNLHFESISFSW